MINAPQIHSDETRNMVSRMIIECHRLDGQIDEWGERELRDDFLELLAKEQTRLLDRVLEGLPDEIELVKQKAGDEVTFLHNQNAIGFNDCLTEVTTTIQKLKEKM